MEVTLRAQSAATCCQLPVTIIGLHLKQRAANSSIGCVLAIAECGRYCQEEGQLLASNQLSMLSQASDLGCTIGHKVSSQPDPAAPGLQLVDPVRL